MHLSLMTYYTLGKIDTRKIIEMNTRKQLSDTNLRGQRLIERNHSRHLFIRKK